MDTENFITAKDIPFIFDHLIKADRMKSYKNNDAICIINLYWMQFTLRFN